MDSKLNFEKKLYKGKKVIGASKIIRPFRNLEDDLYQSSDLEQNKNNDISNSPAD
jgi:hypothetical protein